MLTESSFVEERRKGLHEMLAQSKLSGRSIGREVGESQFHLGSKSVDERIGLEKDVFAVLRDLSTDQFEDIGAGRVVLRREGIDE